MTWVGGLHTTNTQTHTTYIYYIERERERERERDTHTHTPPLITTDVCFVLVYCCKWMGSSDSP